MMKYRKKPVVIEAIYIGEVIEVDEILQFVGWDNLDVEEYMVSIVTLEGKMRVTPHCYIIKGVNGEFYPCQKDIFEKTYEPVE